MNQPTPLQIQSGAADPIPGDLAPIGQLSLSKHSEITFVEDNLADLPTLLKGLSGEVHVLDSSKDGLQQIADLLQGRSNVDALHILSHGASGEVALGSLTLNSGDLAAQQPALQAIHASLRAGGDILLYGCDVGQGAAGQLFIDQLAKATGADVAASTNLTGDAARGGDWKLEISSGQIDAKPVVDAALAAAYHQTLALSVPYTVSFDHGSFSSHGGPNASSDVVYALASNSAYSLKIDGATQGVIDTNYSSTVVLSDYLQTGESLITISFSNNQPFSATSIDLGAGNTETLVVTGKNASGQVVATKTGIGIAGDFSLTTATLSGFTNVTKLEITRSDSALEYGVFIDNLVLSGVTPIPSVSSIVRAASASASVPSASSSVSYTVTFSQSVTGVDSSDFSLTATGSASGSIASVTGSGSTYTVTVNSLSGDGNLRLDLKSSGTGIQNSYAMAIGSGYSSGELYTLDHTAPNAPAALAVASGSDTGSSSSDQISNASAPVISGTAEAGATVTLYDSNGSTVLGTATATGGNWSITSSTLAEGTHTLSAKATDAAGNVSSASSSLSYQLDTTAPTSFNISTTQVTTAAATSGSTVATLSASDSHNISYALATGSSGNDAQNGSFTISGNALVASSSLSAGTYHIYLSATDAAGNATPQAFTLTVVDVPSVSSVVRSSSATAAVQHDASSVSYTVNFSQSVTGVDSSDFSLTAGGTASGHISSISGSGSTYTITVDTLAGDGSLRLDLNSSGTGIQNASSVAIASGYTSGETYVLDHTAPAAPASVTLLTANDSGASSSDHVTNWDNPVVTGTAEANAHITLYDSDGTTVLSTTTADGSGNWAIDSNKTGDGSFTVIAKATDAAGNVSSGTSLSFDVDSVAPASFAISATQVALASATSGATVVTLSSQDAHSVSYALTSGSSGNDADNGSFTVSGGNLVANSSLSAGTYHVHLSATDLAGNVTQQAFSFDVVDAPAVSSIVRANSASAVVQASATSLDYTVSFTQSVTGVDASDFSVSTNGTATGTIDSVSAVSGDTYTVHLTGLGGTGTLHLNLNNSGTGIQNGSSVAIVTGYAGGQAYTLDHTAPAAPAAPVVITANDSGSYSNDGITNYTDPILSGTAEANATVKLYDGNTLLGSTTAANGSGNWSIDPGTLSEGSHQIKVTATDGAGNVSAASAITTVVIDTSANAPATPALITANDSGSSSSDHITHYTTPTFSGTAEAGASVTLYDTDGSTVLGTATANGSGAWSITRSTLGEGSHTITAKQVDLAGNASSASSGLQVTIDTTAPGMPATPQLSPGSDSGTAGDHITNISTPLITGSAEAGATVTLYDSNNSVLGTATANGSGAWSITSSTLSVGQHDLTVKQTDLAGNTSVSSAALTLTIESPPEPPPPPGTTIDGVVVQKDPVTLPGGASGTQFIIPTITSDRVDSSGNAGTADIPIVTLGSAPLLTAQLSVGTGLSSTGGALSSMQGAALQLSGAIQAAAPGDSAAQVTQLQGQLLSALQGSAGTPPVLVQTVLPNMLQQSAGTISLTGPDAAQNIGTVLVVSSSLTLSNLSLSLNRVDAAAIYGQLQIDIDNTLKVLVADAGQQRITVQGGSSASIFAGGGDDTLRFVTQAPSSQERPVQGAAQAGTALLQGGSGNDTAVFSGASSSYTVEQHDGYLVVTAKTQPSQHALLVNVENLQFSDGIQTVQNRAELSTIDGLYQSILGRQADYRGMDFWGTQQKNGGSLGQIALTLMQSAEAQALHPASFNGNAAHDVEMLYQAIFNRASDSAGLAFWTGQMAHGMTLAQVAQALVTAPERELHKIGVQDWNFHA